MLVLMLLVSLLMFLLFHSFSLYSGSPSRFLLIQSPANSDFYGFSGSNSYHDARGSYLSSDPSCSQSSSVSPGSSDSHGSLLLAFLFTVLVFLVPLIIKIILDQSSGSPGSHAHAQ